MMLTGAIEMFAIYSSLSAGLGLRGNVENETFIIRERYLKHYMVGKIITCNWTFKNVLII